MPQPPNKLALAISRAKQDLRALAFFELLRKAGLPKPEREVTFAKVPLNRNWRWDFCWADHWLALEVQGAIFTQGRHTRGAALLREMEKLNAGAMLGYRVMFTTPKQLASPELVAQIYGAINGRKE